MPVTTSDTASETGDDTATAMTTEPDATRPADRSLVDIAKAVFADVRGDNLTLVSAGVAFYALLSLFPAMAAAVSIYGLAFTRVDVVQQLDEYGQALPPAAQDLVKDQLFQLVSVAPDELTFTAVIAIVFALWAASAAIKHLMVALTIVNDATETRGYVRLRATAYALTLGGIVFAGLSIALIAAVPAWVRQSGNDTLTTVVSYVRWPVLMVSMLLALSIVYRFGPDVRRRWRVISWGTVIATGAWIIGSIGFSIYVSRLGRFDATYGSMASVAVLMLWLYVSVFCVLIGAEIDAVLRPRSQTGS